MNGQVLYTSREDGEYAQIECNDPALYMFHKPPPALYQCDSHGIWIPSNEGNFIFPACSRGYIFSFYIVCYIHLMQVCNLEQCLFNDLHAPWSISYERLFHLRYEFRLYKI